MWITLKIWNVLFLSLSRPRAPCTSVTLIAPSISCQTNIWGLMQTVEEGWKCHSQGEPCLLINDNESWEKTCLLARTTSTASFSSSSSNIETNSVLLIPTRSLIYISKLNGIQYCSKIIVHNRWKILPIWSVINHHQVNNVAPSISFPDCQYTPEVNQIRCVHFRNIEPHLSALSTTYMTASVLV